VGAVAGCSGSFLIASPLFSML